MNITGVTGLSTVQLLAMAFRRAYDSDSIISPSHFLNQVQTTIASTNLISSLKDECTIESSNQAVERPEAVKELISKWKGNSKDTRNWTEANKLLRELETTLSTQDK